MINQARNDPFGFRPLWAAILSVYKEFAIICERHGFRYYLAYGNVLGAVRHEGFIPWDDDFDVMMPRKDYDKFLRIAHQELPKKLKLVTWENTPEFSSNYFAKIMNCRLDELAVIEKEIGRELKQGIFIDIFPLDGIPSSRNKLKILTVKKKILDCIAYTYDRRLLGCKTPRQVFGWLLGRVIRFFVFKVRCRTDVNKLTEELISRVPFENATRCGCVISPYGFLKDICDRDTYGDPELLKYEEMVIPCPSNSDKYLKTIYGDYMQFPPLEQQRPSHVAQDEAPWRLGPKVD